MQRNTDTAALSRLPRKKGSTENFSSRFSLMSLIYRGDQNVLTYVLRALHDLPVNLSLSGIRCFQNPSVMLYQQSLFS